MKNPKFIHAKDADKFNLKIAGINKLKSDEYYYHWSSNANGVFRGGKISN